VSFGVVCFPSFGASSFGASSFGASSFGASSFGVRPGILIPSLSKIINL